MNPELSRRVARVMLTEAVRALDCEHHLAFADEVSKSESFDTLPDWVREIVLKGERQVLEEDLKRRARAADGLAMGSHDLQRLFYRTAWEAMSPREDFTTEVLRKAIRRDASPFVRLLQRIPVADWRPSSGELTVDLNSIVHVDAETQLPLRVITEHDSGRLDLVVTLEDATGRRNVVWIEVKIDAAANPRRPGKIVTSIPPECHEFAMRPNRDQLDVYLLHRCLQGEPRPVLITLAKTKPFHDVATGRTRDDITGITWEDVVTAVVETPSPDPWWVDLAEWLRDESIVPNRPRSGDFESLVPVFVAVNREIKRLWPKPPAPMTLWWAEKTLRARVLAGELDHFTGGPMVWGQRDSEAGLEWFVLLGNAGFPGVSVPVDEVLEQGVKGGLPGSWSRVTGRHKDRFKVFEKTCRFVEDDPDEVAIAWLSRAMRELHAAGMMGPHFDRLGRAGDAQG